MSTNSSQRREARTGALVCAGLFTLLLVLATTARTALTDADRVLGRAPYRWADQNNWLEHLAVFIEEVTAPDRVVLVGLLGALGLLLAGHRRAAALAVLAPLLAHELYPLLKGLVERPRPEHADPLHAIGGWSFPSGHATVFGAAAWAAMVIAVSLVGDPVRRRRILSVLSVLAGAVAFDRLLLGVHYFSDVLAGLLLAGAITLALATLLDPYRGCIGTAPAPDRDPD